MTDTPRESRSTILRRDLAIIIAAAWRFTRWPVFAMAGLMIAALVSWGLAEAGFHRKKDEFQNYQDRERGRASTAVLNQLRAAGTEFGNPWSLPLGVDPSASARTGISNRFERSNDGLWPNRSAREIAAVATVDENDRLTRYHLTLRGIDRDALEGHYTLFRTALGTPDVRVGTVEETSTPRLIVWRFDDRIYAIEMRRESGRSWMISINAIHASDPRFDLRFERGGLSAAHGDVETVRQALRGTVAGSIDDPPTDEDEAEQELQRPPTEGIESLPMAPTPDTPPPVSPSPFEARPQPTNDV